MMRHATTLSGRWQAPAAVLPPEGPENEPSPVPVLALASVREEGFSYLH